MMKLTKIHLRVKVSNFMTCICFNLSKWLMALHKCKYVAITSINSTTLWKFSYKKGSVGGSVCRAVASNTIDPRFESNQPQLLFTSICIESTRRKSKDAGNGTLKNCPVPHVRQRWWSARSLPTPEIPSSNQVISNVLLNLIFHVVTVRTIQSE